MSRLAAILRLSEVSALGLVCLGLRAASLVRSCLSDDEAIYAVVAREMLTGRTLYRDVVDHKPPLIYLVYAATQAVGGPGGGMLLLHLLTIAVVLATALTLVRIVRGFAELPSDSAAPFWAGLLYAIFTTTLLPFDALAANCELYMMLPLTGSLWFFLDGARELRSRSLLVAGLLLGVAALFKYQAAAQLALYAGAVLLLGWRRPRKALLAETALATGLAIALGIAVLAMQHARGLDHAWFWFRFNFAYIRTGFSALDLFKRASARVSFVAFPAAFLWILGTVGAVRSLKAATPAGRVWFARFSAAWLALSALAITTGGRFFGHYFHQLTAPLAVLAAPIAAELWRARRRLVTAVVAGPAAAFLLLAFFQRPVFAVAGVTGPDCRHLANLLDTHAHPGDSLVVWGNLPGLYFTAHRPLGTRFVFSNYMTGLSPATPSQSDPSVDASPNIVPESWDMFEADVAARRPRLVLDTSPGNLAAYGKFPPSKYPRLAALLERDYRLADQAHGIRLWVRREGDR
jgi:hypothetical protein